MNKLSKYIIKESSTIGRINSAAKLVASPLNIASKATSGLGKASLYLGSKIPFLGMPFRFGGSLLRGAGATGSVASKNPLIFGGLAGLGYSKLPEKKVPFKTPIMDSHLSTMS